MVLSFVLVPTQRAAAADLGADIDGAKVTFENPRLTSGDDHAWEGMSAGNVTYENGTMHVTAPAGTKGMYWRPNSPYGANGAFGEGGIAMKLKLDYVENPGDWSVMLMIRNAGHKPSWSATNGLYLLFYPHKVALYHVGTSEPLAVLNKPVAYGSYCNIEFITDDLADGTTNVFVLMTDENGELIQNDGDDSRYSMKAEGIPTDTIPAAFISFYSNGSVITSYSMQEGEWTFNKSEEPETTLPDDGVTEDITLEGLKETFTEDKTRVVFENPRITQGADKSWTLQGDAHASYYTVDAENQVLTGTPLSSGTKRLYYMPNSAYGEFGAFGEGGVAMKLNLSFKETATDAYGVMLSIRNTKHSATPENNLSLCFYKDKVTLIQTTAANTSTVLATLNQPVKDAYYNIEFISLDNDGVTTVYVRITDEAGDLLKNDGSVGDFSLAASGLTGLSSGFISFYDNAASIASFSMKEGEWTYAGKEEEPDVPPVVEPEEITLEDAGCYDLSELVTADDWYTFWNRNTTQLTVEKISEAGVYEITARSTAGFYYKLPTQYNDGLQSNLAIAMTVSVDYVADPAADWGFMLTLKADEHGPSWTLNRGIYILVFPDKIDLYARANGSSVLLGRYNGSLEAGKNYNLELAAVENADGTSDVWLKITDENGNLLKNSNVAENATFYIKGVKDIAGKGYIGLYSNSNVVSKYRVSKGLFTNKDAENNGKNWKAESDFWTDEAPVIGDYDYSFAAIGDTQTLVWRYPDKYDAIYQYIINNVESKNIKFAFGLGDITETNSDEEFELARKTIKLLDGKVPYSFIRGNHESVGAINRFFPFSEYEGVWGGSYDGGIENTWQVLKTEKVDYLILCLDVYPSDDVLEWASAVIQAHPNHNVILTTHTYIDTNGELFDGGETVKNGVPADQYNNSEEIWEKLISKHENIVMVLCGHYPSDEVVSNVRTGDHGNKVVTLMIDPSGIDSATFGGAGVVAMLYFSEGGSKVQLEYYSTIRNQWINRDTHYVVELDVVERGEEPGETPDIPTKPGVPYPDLNGIPKYDMDPLGITTQDGLDKYWAPIGGVDYTINSKKDLITVKPVGTEGLYYGPCSPYGGALQKSLAIAMTLGVDFKEGAGDFGYQLILKGNDAQPSWGLTSGVMMLVYPHEIQLCAIDNGAPVVLASYYGSLESGKNYNVEFIAIDRKDGTTDAYLIIADEDGKVLANKAGSAVTLAATGITGVAGEGWVTMFANAGSISEYRFGTGEFTDVAPETADHADLLAVGTLMLLACAAFCVALSLKRKVY